VTSNRYDVIVVLGAKPLPDGTGVPAMNRRVRRAVRLFHDGAANFLLMSGGRNGHSTPEAELMRALAVKEGVPEENIVLESKSTRTLENALFSIKIMKKRGWSRILVVTDGFHLPRALFTFRGFGVKATGSTPPPNYWGKMTFTRRIRIAAREAMGLAAYAAFFLSGQANRIAMEHQGNSAISKRFGE
jgi:uncharacterized SAM-binding protein YcdF (DUF218 family)